MSVHSTEEPQPAATLAGPADWRRIHAFGWPEGSVRGLMALLIFGSTWALLYLRPGMTVPAAYRDLLFIILGHYFASRKRADSGEPAGPPPLYLPRGSIRVVLVLGTAAVAGLLYRDGKLANPAGDPGVVTLLLIGGFLLGVALRAIGTRLFGAGSHPPRVVEDFKAAVALVAAAVLAALVLNRGLAFYPAEQVDTFFANLTRPVHLDAIPPDQILAAVVGFYFGTRS